MSYEMSCRCMDLQKKFYKIQVIDNLVTLYDNGKKLYEKELLKLERVEKRPVEPFICNDDLYLFDYYKGFEIHSIKTGERKFINIRAITQVAKTENILNLVKIKTMVVFDAIKHEVIEEYTISESINVDEYKNYILFYKMKSNKTFLLNIDTSEKIELKNFDSKSSIITKIIVKDNKIVVFYAGRIDKIGVFIYDIASSVSNFYFEFSKFSARGAAMFNYMDFEFNYLEDENKLMEYKNYAEYLYFIYKKFGFYACLYYIDLNEINEQNFKSNLKDIEALLLNYREKVCRFPESNNDYELQMDEIKNMENKFIPLLLNNLNI